MGGRRAGGQAGGQAGLLAGLLVLLGIVACAGQEFSQGTNILGAYIIQILNSLFVHHNLWPTTLLPVNYFLCPW